MDICDRVSGSRVFIGSCILSVSLLSVETNGIKFLFLTLLV